MGAYSGSAKSVGPMEVRVWGDLAGARVQVGVGPLLAAAIRVTGVTGELLVTLDGVTQRWWHAVESDRVWLWCDGQTWVIAPAVTKLRARAEVGGAAEVRSPMPGVVLAVLVGAGDVVEAGQSLIVVEAMKMEHTVRAARVGRVGELLVQVGDHVALDQSIAFILSPEEVSE